MIPPSDLPATLGALRASGWESRTVAEEIAINLEGRIAAGEALSAGVQGFEETVLPARRDFVGRARPSQDTVDPLAGRSPR